MEETDLHRQTNAKLKLITLQLYIQLDSQILLQTQSTF